MTPHVLEIWTEYARDTLEGQTLAVECTGRQRVLVGCGVLARKHRAVLLRVNVVLELPVDDPTSDEQSDHRHQVSLHDPPNTQIVTCVPYLNNSYGSEIPM